MKDLKDDIFMSASLETAKIRIKKGIAFILFVILGMIIVLKIGG